MSGKIKILQETIENYEKLIDDRAKVITSLLKDIRSLENQLRAIRNELKGKDEVIAAIVNERHHAANLSSYNARMCEVEQLNRMYKLKYEGE